MKAEAIVFHGWGFDRSCWKGWEEFLDGLEIAMTTYDRGYYGQPKEVAFSKNAKIRLAITHSFGLHLCPVETRQMADILIIFSGFTRFHPDGGPAKRRSERLHRAMCDRFRDAPARVLDDFFRQCGCPLSAQPRLTDTMDVILLQRDLHDLADSVISPAPAGSAERVLVLHGIEDRIVPPEKGREIASRFGALAGYFEIESAGHALPFTHTEECLVHMKPFLRDMGIG